MWLGGHDLLPLNHVKKLKEILDSTDAVLAYSNAVHLTDEYVFKNVYQYNYSAHLCSENPAERVLSIISDLSDCTLYHGCYRFEVIKSALTHAYHEKYNGIDHGILGEVALLGKMILCKDTTYYRIEPREDKYDILHNWNRVIVSIYSNIYNKNIHIPELIPIGICYIQLRTAQKAAKFSKESDLYIDRIKHILWTRWADNEFIKDYIQKNFHIAKMHKSIPVRILRELSRNLRKLYKIIRT
jgi:hypothetical protein